MTPENIARFQRRLDELMDLALLYGHHEKTEGSAIYVVRGQVFRSFPR